MNGDNIFSLILVLIMAIVIICFALFVWNQATVVWPEETRFIENFCESHEMKWERIQEENYCFNGEAFKVICKWDHQNTLNSECKFLHNGG